MKSKKGVFVKKISIKYRILTIIIMIQIPFLILLRVYAYYAIGNINIQLAKGYSEALKVFCNSVTTQLINADDFLGTDCWGNPDYRKLAAVDSKEEAKEILEVVADKAEILLENNVNISGVSYYFQKSDLSYDLYSPNESFADEERLQMEQLTARVRQEGSHTNTAWTFLENSNKTYIVRTFEYEGAFTTVIVDLQKLSEKSQTFYRMSTPVVFLKGGQVITEAYWSKNAEEEFQPRDNITGYQLVTSRDNKYLVVDEPVMTMTALYGVRYNYNWDWLNVVIYLSVAVSILSFVLAWFRFHTTFFKPLRRLLGVMDAIRGGDYSARAEGAKNKEFTIINETFNETLDAMENLKIQTYKNEIEAKNSQMNALRLQIRRHFFLNCLKNIYAMARSGDTGDIQEVVLLLSGHLRYTLDISKNNVELQTELDMCRNYIELQGIGQERKPILIVYLEEELKEFPIPPISILTLVENCCKYGMTQDKTLIVTIDISLRLLDEERFVNIMVLDNGFGFNESILRKLNTNAVALDSDGHVGIANVMERMKMMYGVECAMIFANMEGASVELIIPLKGDGHEVINSR